MYYAATVPPLKHQPAPSQTAINVLLSAALAQFVLQTKLVLKSVVSPGIVHDVEDCNVTVTSAYFTTPKM